MTRNKKIAACIVGGIGMMLASAAPTLAQVASWYGEELRGSPVACTGQPYDPDGFTAAHKTIPCGTKLLVRHEGRGVTVTVNDRGPFVAGRDLDLSKAAAQKIGVEGVEEVEVTQTASEPVTQLPNTGGP